MEYVNIHTADYYKGYLRMQGLKEYYIQEFITILTRLPTLVRLSKPCYFVFQSMEFGEVKFYL